MKHIQIITTTDKKEVAARIAKSLVSKRLAACVQTWPVNSTFSWKGRIALAREYILLIKARSSDYRRVEKEIGRLHNYELPEIIAVPIQEGSNGYLNWMDKATKR